mmetsp:Transcript_7860/g.14100  ORF Transcript_7860/g.14100 Transcript_7860/m.14100 type:complete len:102 (-) Transcript_7860:1041-1346(-)
MVVPLLPPAPDDLPMAALQAMTTPALLLPGARQQTHSVPAHVLEGSALLLVPPLPEPLCWLVLVLTGAAEQVAALVQESPMQLARRLGKTGKAVQQAMPLP